MTEDGNNVSKVFCRRLTIYPYFGATAFTIGILGLGLVALFGPNPNDSLWPYYLYLFIICILIVGLGNYLFWRCPSCNKQIAGPLTDIDTILQIYECPHCGVTLLRSNKSLKSGTPESGAP